MDSKINADPLAAAHYLESIPKAAQSNLANDSTCSKPPITGFESFLRLAQIESAVAVTIPAIVGAAFAWGLAGTFRPVEFSLAFGAYLFLLIGLNVLSEYSDYRFGLRPESKFLNEDPSFASANLIANGLFRPNCVIGLGSIFIAVALCFVSILTLMSPGWPVLFFFGLTGFCLSIYLVPPMWHGYLSVGIGELGILLGCGVVQTTGNYYIQTETISLPVLWLGIPLGLMCTLVLFSRTLIRQRRNWMIRKRTLAVTLGEQRSVYFCILLIIAAYASLILVVSLTPLTLWLLFGLATLPVALRRFKETENIVRTPDDCLYLHRLMIKMLLYTGLLMLLIIVIDRMT